MILFTSYRHYHVAGMGARTAWFWFPAYEHVKPEGAFGMHALPLFVAVLFVAHYMSLVLTHIFYSDTQP